MDFTVQAGNTAGKMNMAFAEAGGQEMMEDGLLLVQRKKYILLKYKYCT